MLEPFLLAILLTVSVTVVALISGSVRWKSATKSLHERLEQARLPGGCATYREDELTGLPVPVQKYFRAVLDPGQPLIRAATIDHVGTFNTSGTSEQWKPFRSTQRVVTRRPGFLWDARIRMMPGIEVKVHDAYVGGEGILQASFFGLLSLANVRGTPEMAQGELMRFLAEAAWYPTALLPSHGIEWNELDDSSATATLKDGETSLTLTFRFNREGVIESVRADARGRIVRGEVIPTPWEGRWRSYEPQSGMLVPIEGEVSWILPEGPRPYWRGRVTSVRYDFASPG